MRIRTISFVLSTVLWLPALAGEQEILNLPIGDPERKDRKAELVLDAITDCATGELITPDQLAGRLEQVRLLFVGESHVSMEFHRVQLRVIEELHKAGRKVLIGLEMYPYTDQEYLDQWVGGMLTEEGFIELSEWYDSWGYHWNYYRDIFLFARRKGIPMYALNTPREVIRAVRMKGFESLTEEEAGRVPSEIDTESEEHFSLFKAFFADEGQFHMGMTDEQWQGMFNAQCTWDATMGYNSVKALQRHEDSGAIMVVLIGQGHVAYGLGIQRQAAQWFDGRMAAVIPIPVTDDDGEIIRSVQASYADFIWGLPPENDTLYPSLGLATTKMDDSKMRKVVHVAEESVAERAGFMVGDILLSMDGIDLPNREAANRRMAFLQWGDTASYEVKRGEETLTLTAYFRREPPEPCEEEKEE
jgi:uncharacterized iron-regulated protein